jgi:hypothetical protein
MGPAIPARTRTKTVAERCAPLTKELARRRSGKPLTPVDVHEQIASLVDELVVQGMTRSEAAGLVNRAAQKATAA